MTDWCGLQHRTAVPAIAGRLPSRDGPPALRDVVCPDPYGTRAETPVDLSSITKHDGVVVPADSTFTTLEAPFAAPRKTQLLSVTSPIPETTLAFIRSLRLVHRFLPLRDEASDDYGHRVPVCAGPRVPRARVLFAPRMPTPRDSVISIDHSTRRRVKPIPFPRSIADMCKCIEHRVLCLKDAKG